MSKMSRIMLIIIVSTTLWLLNYSDAEAGWHSPNESSLWTIKPICQDGVQILRLLPPTMDGWDDPDYRDDMPLNFSAFITNLPSSDEPQAVEGEWPNNTLKILLNSETVVMHYSRPLAWVDDDGSIGPVGQSYTAYVYGRESIEWAPLPVGTPVMVHLTGGTGDYFIGSVTDCKVNP